MASSSCFFNTITPTPHLSSKLNSAELVLFPPRAIFPTLSYFRDLHSYAPNSSSPFSRRDRRSVLATAVAEETSSPVEEEDAGQSTKLYFGNLPYNCDSAQLAGVIQEYASPEMVEVLYDRETGRSRGFAFVTMSTVEDCEAVIKNLDGTQFSGRTMRVNFADKPKAKMPLYPETEFKLFVGNLSWSVTPEMLMETFQECGNVVGARVIYDGDTGRSKGYGFVCYSNKEEMDKALQTLNGLELEGRDLRISVAMGKRS